MSGANVQKMIGEHGWAVIGVFPTAQDDGVPFAYTVGLTDKGLPELAVYGLDPVTGGAISPLTVAFDFSGSTQYGSDFGVTALSQNGSTSGKIAGFNVAEDGVIRGRYTNGQTRDLGQIVLSTFVNAQGLNPLGDGQFAETPRSGLPVTGGPGSGTLGLLQSAALEEGNVDLTEALVDLITAQRNYQANAQTIKTNDAVLQTLVNLR
jgi:flagellar hook protein FlgE